MGAFKDLAIIEENSKQEERTMFKLTDKEGYSALVSEELLDVVREATEIGMRRRMCCEPYDCMCHEICDGEGAECGSCAARRKAWRLEGELGADEAHNPEQVSLGWIQQEIERDVAIERVQFYREMRALGNENATHWTDEEAAR